MKKFWGYASNGRVSVGCTGQAVQFFDGIGNEIGKFKNITYGYIPIISPDGTLAVVKSTEGRLAIYSLETVSLIKKFRFSKVNGAQDDGFCFSPDGKLFLNVERQKDSLHSAISIYDTTDFSLANQVLLGEDMVLDHIEFDETTKTYYVLGFIRDRDGIYDYGFVAKFEDNQTKNIIAITDNEYDFYQSYKHLEIRGFTQKTHDWSELVDCELDKLKTMNHTIAKLHTYYTKSAAE